MDERHDRSGGIAPLVQVALALLVAGTLVTFSVLALRTGFADQPRGEVQAVGPETSEPRPLLLPSPDARRSAAEPAIRGATADSVAASSEVSDRVLGDDLLSSRDRTAEDRDPDDGRKRLDNFERSAEAREPEDFDDDHGQEDDESDDSYTGSRNRSKNRSRGHSGKSHREKTSASRGHSHGSRGHSDGSRGHSRGSRGHSRH